jgi:tetratricopeptide (TPR) repeat protein
MRLFRFVGLILSSLLVLPAAAQEQDLTTGPSAPSPEAMSPGATSPQASTARLLDLLKRERDPDKARSIASQLMTGWNESGSATVNLLMQWAAKSVAEKKNAAALDFLDHVTLLDPDYVEGWNKRATLHYAMGDPRKSMSDIQQVLQRQPSHFAAIAGMATILTENGEDELALKAWERFLAIYPAERDAQENMSKLSEKLAGNRT